LDAVEVARQRAEALHAEAVSAGVDPWLPLALVGFVAARLDIDVEPVAPGSPLLAGGRAVFDPAARAIRHEDLGNDFYRAFLVSHELGHALLGDDLGEHVAVAIEPARSAEAAPVGEDRVADYSRRQRREIQMDLFARELLIPRSRVRNLHLGGMTASEMAQRTGAPFDAVAQQLLDALLLPPIEPSAPTNPEPVRPLNDDQLAAASHRGEPYLLEAGPGTGKTQTLVGRIVSLLDEGVDPRSILILTFSNKAAGELADRIAAQRPDVAAALWVGTFHAFGLDIVRRFHRELGFEKEPRLMDRSEAVGLLEQDYLSLGLVHHRELWDPSRRLKDMLSAISRAKDEVADAVRFAELANSMVDTAAGDDERIAAERCAEVALVFGRYEELKRQACAVDFGDLVSLPVMLLEQRPEIATQLRDRYAHVLVDEYQDVNRSSVRLLRRLTERGEGLWAVGDARQAIYRFRGASSYSMARFATDDFPGAAVGRLRINYRSTPAIVGAFSTFGADMVAGAGDARLTADRAGPGVLPRHVSFGDNDDEADALAEEIRVLVPEVGLRGQAVLCPGNDRLARIGRELERRGIPVLYLGNLFDRPEVKDLLSLLSMLIDRRAMALVRSPALDGLPMDLSLAGAAGVMQALRDADPAPLGWTDVYADLAGLTQADQATLERLADLLDGFGPNDHPWLVLARVLLDWTRTAALLADTDDVATRAMGIAIWQLMGFLRTEGAGPGLPVQRLLDKIRRLVLLADERDLRQLPQAAQGIEAVRLMTIHGSKGLEFPAVHVMGLNPNSMPSAARTPACPVPDGMIEGGEGGTVALAATDHRMEQECLFYVALSRARDRLHLYSATRDGGGRRRNPSPFIARIGPTDPRTAAANPLRPTDPEMASLPIRLSRPITITTAQLDLYVRCPRRFLYTHVLGVGGRRTSTTLSQMHDVVRAVVERLAAVECDAHASAQVRELFDATWQAGPLATVEFDLHRDVALSLVQRFAASRSGGTRLDIRDFDAALDGAIVIARADDVIATSAGTVVARIVRTGHRMSTSGQSISDAAFHIATASSLPGCLVEVLHLSEDEPTTTVSFEPRALGRHRDKLSAALTAIGDGRFKPNRSERTCPTCPSFFICGDVRAGALEKNL
jgi:superfamily I DNA/RNA helicase